MKLVRIEHVRCGEYDGYTYMLAPDDTSEDKLDNDVFTAMNNYLNALGEFKKLNKRPERLYFNLDNIPDNVTMSEAKELTKQRDEEIKKWDDAERKCTRSFGCWMHDLGYRFLSEAEDNEIMESSVNWGHRHGEHIEYDVTKTDIELHKKEVRLVKAIIRKSEPISLDNILRKIGIKK